MSFCIVPGLLIRLTHQGSFASPVIERAIMSKRLLDRAEKFGRVQKNMLRP